MILVAAPAELPPIDFDLGKVDAAHTICPAGGTAGDIVVCSRKRTQDHVAVSPLIEDGLPKAEIGLFGKVRGRIGAQQGNVGGFTAPRVMATVIVPF